MKTRFFKSVLPALALMLAVGGAFAFSHPAGKSVVLDVNGFIPGQVCEETEVICQTQNNGVFCTNASSVWLYKMNASGTACPDHLYRKQ